MDIEVVLQAYFDGYLIRARSGRESWWLLTSTGAARLAALEGVHDG